MRLVGVNNGWVEEIYTGNDTQKWSRVLRKTSDHIYYVIAVVNWGYPKELLAFMERTSS